jgi:hypothetical protein
VHHQLDTWHLQQQTDAQQAKGQARGSTEARCTFLTRPDTAFLPLLCTLGYGVHTPYAVHMPYCVRFQNQQNKLQSSKEL